MYCRFGRIGRNPVTIAHGHVHLYAGCLLICIIFVQVGLHAWFLDESEVDHSSARALSGHLEFWLAMFIALLPCLLHIPVSHQTVKFGCKTPCQHSALWKTLWPLRRSRIFTARQAGTFDKANNNGPRKLLQLHGTTTSSNMTKTTKVTTAVAAMTAAPCTATVATEIILAPDPSCIHASMQPRCSILERLVFPICRESCDAQHNSTSDAAVIVPVRYCFGNTGSHPDGFSKICALNFGRKILILVLKMLLSAWWYTYPSEKYERQLGCLFPIYGKIKDGPNHQRKKQV